MKSKPLNKLKDCGTSFLMRVFGLDPLQIKALRAGEDVEFTKAQRHSLSEAGYLDKQVKKDKELTDGE